MPSESAVALPPIRTWELRNRSGQIRTFEQSELSIEGEVRLIQLVGATIRKLTAAGFPWEEVARVINTDGDIDWEKASEMLLMIIAEVPEIVGDSAATMLGLYPVDIDGNRNTDFDNDKRFLKESLSSAKWIDMLQTFTEQNDYKRLARPLSLAASRALTMGLTLADRSSQTSTGSSTQDTANLEEFLGDTPPDRSTGTETP